ncbi:hypothetical protein [Mucilaginibacter boryungensis]|uniref:Lipoprotein n=1 Tax=Mucilaginibacter boryungensis TaxID=768480 RepID=A0ABR9XJ00_9SPHI|nr:hypothetical protein [Mucilaginibacter boryungensis]MBE9667356.1 hypothetical protein [Mucilaginibacter boryungensis]
MKNKTILFAIAITSIVTFASCSGDHAARPGVDSAGNNIATNPYRDTFANTNTYGDAINADNSGSGGVKIVKPHASAQVTATADTAKKM